MGMVFEYKVADGRFSDKKLCEAEKKQIEKHKPSLNQRAGGGGRPPKKKRYDKK